MVSPTSDREESEILLEVRDLVKHFEIPGSRHYVQACQSVSFDLRRGETLGVVGESGSGKTTLGRCVLRLIQPTSGEIIFQGLNLQLLSIRELRRLRRDMQIVYQEPQDSFNPFYSIGHQLAEPIRRHLGASKAERRRRIDELLRAVGLPYSIVDAHPDSLSAGTLQRCAIARALATEPKLIVLDEPTSALPPEAEADILRLLQQLQQRLSLSYLFISHDLTLVRQFCDRVAVMYLSQVVEISTQDELFARPRHPYSRALLASTLVPDPDKKRDAGDRAERLQGEIPSPIDLPKGCYLASRCPYVRDRCQAEPQNLFALSDNHSIRCWRVQDGDLSETEITAIRRQRRAALGI